MCQICGDERDLSPVLRFWSPDDGWVAGRLCKWCRKSEEKRKPCLEDYAWEKRGELFSDEEDALGKIYG